MPELRAAATDYQPTREVKWPKPVKLQPKPPPKPGAWGEVVTVDGEPHRLRLLRWVDIEDGLSNTSLIAESVGLPEFFDFERTPYEEENPGFDAPYGAWAIGSLQFTSTRINERSDSVLFSLHPGGPLCAMADGSVHAVPATLPEDAVAALVTREEGDVSPILSR
jgi:hypothetical protein